MYIFNLLLLIVPHFLILFVSDAESQKIPVIVPPNYNCTTAGRFRYSDPTCRSYYLCVLYNGNYVKSNYTCPSTMMFNPSTQTCVAIGDATCIENACADKTLITDIGVKMPDPNQPDCSTYIQCLYGPDGFYPIIGTCPGGLLFNQNITTPDCAPIGNCAVP